MSSLSFVQRAFDWIGGSMALAGWEAWLQSWSGNRNESEIFEWSLSRIPNSKGSRSGCRIFLSRYWWYAKMEKTDKTD